MSLIRKFIHDQSGATMVEYSIVIGLITAAAVGLIGLQSPKIVAAWTTLDGAW